MTILAGKALQEGFAITLAADVVGDEVDIIEGEQDEIVALAALAHGAGGGGTSFLVRGLTVNDGGEFLLRVAAHALPHAHDVAAGGVHHEAAARTDDVHDARLG